MRLPGQSHIFSERTVSAYNLFVRHAVLDSNETFNCRFCRVDVPARKAVVETRKPCCPKCGAQLSPVAVRPSKRNADKRGAAERRALRRQRENTPAAA